jgi:hypothetical protein
MNQKRDCQLNPSRCQRGAPVAGGPWQLPQAGSTSASPIAAELWDKVPPNAQATLLFVIARYERRVLPWQESLWTIALFLPDSLQMPIGPAGLDDFADALVAMPHRRARLCVR